MTIIVKATDAQPVHDAGQALHELVGALHDIHPDGNPVFASRHIVADPRWARLMAAMHAARATLDAISEPADAPIDASQAGAATYWWLEGYEDYMCPGPDPLDALCCHKESIPEGAIIAAHGCREITVETAYVAHVAGGLIKADTFTQAQKVVDMVKRLPQGDGG
ncbi:hypothetical protein P7L78_19235 [Tistrella bauzanensis]|uniref:hypothetical protein n=1 Tax=Tistrella TaxID=171436 RepID=UPI0031F6E815